MMIAVDFDGVIHDDKNPAPGRKMGPPVENALAGITQLLADGHQVIVHTVRGDKPKHVEDWLAYFGFPALQVTNVKPTADIYLDDRARQFTDWESVGAILYPEVWA